MREKGILENIQRSMLKDTKYLFERKGDERVDKDIFINVVQKDTLDHMSFKYQLKTLISRAILPVNFLKNFEKYK